MSLKDDDPKKSAIVFFTMILLGLKCILISLDNLNFTATVPKPSKMVVHVLARDVGRRGILV